MNLYKKSKKSLLVFAVILAIISLVAVCRQTPVNAATILQCISYVVFVVTIITSMRGSQQINAIWYLTCLLRTISFAFMLITDKYIMPNIILPSLEVLALLFTGIWLKKDLSAIQNNQMYSEEEFYQEPDGDANNDDYGA